MSYNKKELLSLPAEEKIALAEELWSSVEEELMPVTDEEVAFAEERLKMHEANPEERMSVEELKKYFFGKNMAFKLVIKPIVLFDLDEAVFIL